MLKRLSDSQLNELHTATLEVMERTGVRMRDEEAVAILTKGGCTVVDGCRVKFPPKLVEWALDVVPKRLQLYNQKAEPVM